MALINKKLGALGLVLFCATSYVLADSIAEKVISEIGQKVIAKLIVPGGIYTKTAIFSEEVRQTINKNLTLEPDDPRIADVKKECELPSSIDVFYDSQHFTYVDIIRISDRLFADGGVAHLISLDAGGSIWIWSSAPRFSPKCSVLVTRSLLKSKNAIQTDFRDAWWTRLSQYQQFKIYMEQHAQP